jgi:hypothetical protein
VNGRRHCRVRVAFPRTVCRLPRVPGAAFPDHAAAFPERNVAAFPEHNVAAFPEHTVAAFPEHKYRLLGLLPSQHQRRRRQQCSGSRRWRWQWQQCSAAATAVAQQRRVHGTRTVQCPTRSVVDGRSKRIARPSHQAPAYLETSCSSSSCSVDMRQSVSRSVVGTPLDGGLSVTCEYKPSLLSTMRTFLTLLRTHLLLARVIRGSSGQRSRGQPINSERAQVRPAHLARPRTCSGPPPIAAASCGPSADAHWSSQRGHAPDAICGAQSISERHQTLPSSAYPHKNHVQRRRSLR